MKITERQSQILEALSKGRSKKVQAAREQSMPVAPTIGMVEAIVSIPEDLFQRLQAHLGSPGCYWSIDTFIEQAIAASLPDEAIAGGTDGKAS